MFLLFGVIKISRIAGTGAKTSRESKSIQNLEIKKFKDANLEICFDKSLIN